MASVNSIPGPKNQLTRIPQVFGTRTMERCGDMEITKKTSLNIKSGFWLWEVWGNLCLSFSVGKLSKEMVPLIPRDHINYTLLHQSPWHHLGVSS